MVPGAALGSEGAFGAVLGDTFWAVFQIPIKSLGLHWGSEGAFGAELGNTFQGVFQIPTNSFNLSGNTLQAKLFRLSFRCLSVISGTRNLANQQLTH